MVILKTKSSAILAAHAMRGDSAALEILLGRLEPEVTKVTRAIAPGSWAAEEAAQEALLDAMCRIDGLRDPELVVAWARKIAARRAFAAIKREATLGVEPLDPALLGPDLNLKTRPLLEAFRALPARQRAVAGLRLILGLSESEVSQLLEIAPGTTKFHLHAARRRLQVELRDRGVEPQVGGADR
jgi:RNA polymerase sigma factor (sigma-70 family)